MTTDELARRVDALRADMERTRADYEQIMVHLAGLSSALTDESKRRALELFATVVATDYELKVLLLQDLSYPTDREVWEKYMALLSWAAIDELPPKIGIEYREAGRAFKDALKPIKSDGDYMSNLTEIRNRVVAHRDLEGGDHWLAQWHLTAITNKHNGRSVVQSTASSSRR
ncbi:hypothetical protein [Agromyces marinus]|uniref:hypothetical protein n=1 Tax=Agromyces marinus TaxID=1389020 RepID=UPI001F36E9F8|nr:hypothetical protein [Agromyces marinus]